MPFAYKLLPIKESNNSQLLLHAGGSLWASFRSPKQLWKDSTRSATRLISTTMINIYLINNFEKLFDFLQLSVRQDFPRAKESSSRCQHSCHRQLMRRLSTFKFKRKRKLQPWRKHSKQEITENIVVINVIKVSPITLRPAL